MSEIIDVEALFRRMGINVLLRNLKTLLTAAILDPSESIRLNHIKTLDKMCLGVIQRGF